MSDTDIQDDDDIDDIDEYQYDDSSTIDDDRITTMDGEENDNWYMKFDVNTNDRQYVIVDMVGVPDIHATITDSMETAHTAQPPQLYQATTTAGSIPMKESHVPLEERYVTSSLSNDFRSISLKESTPVKGNVMDYETMLLDTITNDSTNNSEGTVSSGTWTSSYDCIYTNNMSIYSADDSMKLGGSDYDIISMTGTLKRQCRRCTYINNDDVFICQACDTALVANPSSTVDALLANQIQRNVQETIYEDIQMQEHMRVTIREQPMADQTTLFMNDIQRYLNGCINLRPNDMCFHMFRNTLLYHSLVASFIEQYMTYTSGSNGGTTGSSYCNIALYYYTTTTKIQRYDNYTSTTTNNNDNYKKFMIETMIRECSATPSTIAINATTVAPQTCQAIAKDNVSLDQSSRDDGNVSSNTTVSNTTTKYVFIVATITEQYGCDFFHSLAVQQPQWMTVPPPAAAATATTRVFDDTTTMFRRRIPFNPKPMVPLICLDITTDDDRNTIQTPNNTNNSINALPITTNTRTKTKTTRFLPTVLPSPNYYESIFKGLHNVCQDFFAFYHTTHFNNDHE